MPHADDRIAGPFRSTDGGSSDVPASGRHRRSDAGQLRRLSHRRRRAIKVEKTALVFAVLATDSQISTERFLEFDVSVLIGANRWPALFFGAKTRELESAENKRVLANL